jgi:hypothetical protein
MYFFHCEETRPLVSIFTYIDAMLLNLEAPVTQQTKRKFVNLSVPYSKISKNLKILKKKYILKFKIQNFPKISIFQKNVKFSYDFKIFKILIFK